MRTSQRVVDQNEEKQSQKGISGTPATDMVKGLNHSEVIYVCWFEGKTNAEYPDRITGIYGSNERFVFFVVANCRYSMLSAARGINLPKVYVLDNRD